ncbi:hypothetical protein AI2694V1_1738 [Enterobacter cloacae]|uniref:hypothetical protein n=1 Tax=Enterobacter asburiae TaxID=61645 RepID=UPI000649CBB8|nr:hypothetical protein [Enterobacter asburiae]CAE7070773.1 hypothetical protein AI2694V1_1493 [Enterobacter cloacae]AKL00454.1 hypothetical protein AB190_07645 [Enterobacter asburiae]CAE7075613.1 hypothetical protein AI2694V1_1738 [Enterobacter cloacae]CAE7470460.1 hypothetical protein AI2674V1_1482 [Enterobacter cloacae]CAE7473258.1 hypothetical protein AI2674V1_1727 [Enterobacter cloacae]
MKDLSIEYRGGKFVQLVIDGVVMKGVTSIEFSHSVGQDVPTLSVSGHLWPEPEKTAPVLQQVDKDSA